MKVVILRSFAKQDAADATNYYARHAGTDMALRFVDALQAGYRAISLRPATGSARFAHELEMPGLRTRKLRQFPYLIFYVERPDHIDIWRVLHAKRDIPAWLTIDS